MTLWSWKVARLRQVIANAFFRSLTYQQYLGEVVAKAQDELNAVEAALVLVHACTSLTEL